MGYANHSVARFSCSGPTRARAVMRLRNHP
jgi:hypothetical protein